MLRAAAGQQSNNGVGRLQFEIWLLSGFSERLEAFEEVTISQDVEHGNAGHGLLLLAAERLKEHLYSSADHQLAQWMSHSMAWATHAWLDAALTNSAGQLARTGSTRAHGWVRLQTDLRQRRQGTHSGGGTGGVSQVRALIRTL